MPVAIFDEGDALFLTGDYIVTELTEDFPTEAIDGNVGNAVAPGDMVAVANFDFVAELVEGIDTTVGYRNMHSVGKFSTGNKGFEYAIDDGLQVLLDVALGIGLVGQTGMVAGHAGNVNFTEVA